VKGGVLHAVSNRFTSNGTSAQSQQEAKALNQTTNVSIEEGQGLMQNKKSVSSISGDLLISPGHVAHVLSVLNGENRESNIADEEMDFATRERWRSKGKAKLNDEEILEHKDINKLEKLGCEVECGIQDLSARNIVFEDTERDPCDEKLSLLSSHAISDSPLDLERKKKGKEKVCEPMINVTDPLLEEQNQDLIFD